MRVILETNVLVSALLTRRTPPSALYDYWRAGRFALISCEQQLDEIRRVCARPFFRSRLRPSKVGRLVNDIRRLALMPEPDQRAEESRDPDDNFLLDLARVGDADVLVTGDRSGLLELQRHGRTRIVTARVLADALA